MLLQISYFSIKFFYRPTLVKKYALYMNVALNSLNLGGPKLNNKTT